MAGKIIEAVIPRREAKTAQAVLTDQGLRYERLPHRGGADLYRVLLPGPDTGETLRRLRQSIASFRLIAAMNPEECDSRPAPPHAFRALGAHRGMAARRLFGCKKA